MSDDQQNTPIVQRLDTLEETVSRLSEAVDSLVTDFLRPLAQQSVANQAAIAALIETSQRHEDWLDEDRRDLSESKDDYQQSIQILLDDAKSDRKRFDDKFAERQKQSDERFAEIKRQSDERFAEMKQQSDERQKQSDERFSEMKQQSDERFAEVQSELRNNQRTLLSGQEKLDRNQQQIETVLSEVLSLSRRVAVVEDRR